MKVKKDFSRLKNVLIQRPRRNRRSPQIRSLVRETDIRPQHLVAPVFVIEGEDQVEPIFAMPGVDRLSVDPLLKKIETWHLEGVSAVALFPVIDAQLKDLKGSEALNEQGLIPKTILAIKREFPSVVVITDIALDPFTTHGHDGIPNADGIVLNDATVSILSQMALLHAACGADFVAPSDMMDGRVGAIRQELDQNGFEDVGIIAYSSKYASSLYAPFRTALRVNLQMGDKKNYQMDPANVREALREAALDEKEGADILMIKPALFYLDVIAKVRSQTHLPIAAFHVSGEYAMVMAAHEKGLLDANAVFFEAALAMRRSGADLIFTYAIDALLIQLA